MNTRFYRDKKGQVLYVTEFNPSKEIYVKCLGSFPDDKSPNNSIIVDDEITPEQLKACKVISENDAMKLNPHLVNLVRAVYLD